VRVSVLQEVKTEIIPRITSALEDVHTQLDGMLMLFLPVHHCGTGTSGWLHGSVAERRSSAGVLFMSCTRPAGDG